MGSSFAEYFLQHLPTAVVVILGVLVLLVVVTVWCTKTWGRMKNLPCQHHSNKMDNHEWRIGSIDTTLSKMEGKIDMLVTFVSMMSPTQKGSILSSDTPTLSQKNSPKALNNNGQKVFDCFGCGEFMHNNQTWLLEELSKLSPKTALDAEMMSLSALRLASTDDRFNELKDKIYHSPAIELTLPDGKTKSLEIGLEDVLFVLSLPLRDAYLKLHPEII